ncbi:MAG: phosphotransferase, partial [Nitrospirae bacterium]|nr:phosphotransferase [Nitrospirota bacterium]
VFDALKSDGETLYFHSGAEGCADTSFNGHISVEEGCLIGHGVSLRNCIILPGSILEQGTYENCIIGTGFEVPFVECGKEVSGDNGNLIGIGGSDRKYFRVKKDGISAVMMQCAAGDQDFVRHLEYTRFFRKYALPVPEIISADAEKMKAFLEDLGDMSLYSWLKCPRERGDVELLYRKALDMLIKLHARITSHVAECPLLAGRAFDYNHLRWETAYFTERFVEGTRGMALKNRQALEDEFKGLALKADAFPKTIVHRDFQSQNIMVLENEKLRLIDYQGARMAPPAYDVVSLLWDPYCRLDDAIRTRLLNYYTDGMTAECCPGFDAGQFMETLLTCRLQRHMQALGAYGFLSAVKGKKFFLKHVPEALRMLKEEAAIAVDEYPVLHALVNEL